MPPRRTEKEKAETEQEEEEAKAESAALAYDIPACKKNNAPILEERPAL